MPDPPKPNQDRTHDRLTWQALLSNWVEFARAAVVLPESPHGERWRASVSPLITLQAVAHALGEVDAMPETDRTVALDKAELLLHQSTSELDDAWRGTTLPGGIREAIDDAQAALAEAHAAGWCWWVREAPFAAGHPGEIGEALAEAGFEGTLLLPSPGIPLSEGSPAGVLIPTAGDLERLDLAGLAGAVSSFLGDRVTPARRREAVQVYRQFDFAQGKPVRDVIAPLAGEPLAGQPLLAPVVIDGDLQPVPMAPRRPEPVEGLEVAWADKA